MGELITKYLRFVAVPTDPDRKTGIWDIISRHHGDRLGQIRWYPQWRQYCFYPEPDTIWNTACMATVNDFIAGKMAARG